MGKPGELGWATQVHALERICDAGTEPTLGQITPDVQRQLISREAWAALRRWYADNGRHGLPWRDHRTPWKILLAEALLHRTRAEAAASLFPALLAQFPDPASVLASPGCWLTMVRPAGLAWRAEAFLACCAELVNRFGGRVPETRATLESLAGVGHYTAAAVRCFGFGLPSSLVDTNTIRLASRLSGEAASPAAHRADAVQQLVGRLGDRGQRPIAEDNFALLDLAALICVPSKPRCCCCPLRSCCVTGRESASEPNASAG
jgi:A/G-specific adenine glycosylase